MLPTNEKAGVISIGNTSGVVEYHSFQYKKNGIYNNHTFYHLYILSDEEIKEVDWGISKLNEIVQFKKNYDSSLYKKIIATTDKSLVVKYDDRFEDVTINNKSLNQLLSQIPQSFIGYFVEQYNRCNVITEVMVEYDCDHTRMPAKIIDVLKINPDNTINIKPIKDSWNKEEVIKLMKRSIDRGIQLKKDYKVIHKKDHIDKWVEKNHLFEDKR